MKATEQYFPVVLFILLNTSVRINKSRTNVLTRSTHGISSGSTSASMFIDSVLALAVGAAARRILSKAIWKKNKILWILCFGTTQILSSGVQPNFSYSIYCILDVTVAVAVVDSCGPNLHKTKFEVSSQFNPQELFWTVFSRSFPSFRSVEFSLSLSVDMKHARTDFP